MAKIDKQFSYLNLLDISKYNYLDKETNVNNNIGYMLNRSNIMFKYHNLPDTVPERELEKLNQTNGFSIWCKINGDLYAINGGLGGVGDVYNRPTQAVISVPYLNYNATLDIDTDCVIMSNDSNNMGLLPMFAKYCTLMNENEITMLLATVNKRIQNLLSANDDNTVASAKQFLTDVFSGKQGVIAESKLFDSLKVNNSTNNTNVSLTDLFEFEQYLKASMYNEIGLSANFNMKRERLTSAEVESNTDNLYPLVDDMLNNRRTALEKINSMFETDIEVEFNSSWDYRIFNGASIHNTEVETDGTTEVETDGTTEVETDGTTEVETDGTTEVETDGTTEVETDGTTEVETDGTTEVETGENDDITELETDITDVETGENDDTGTDDDKETE